MKKFLLGNNKIVVFSGMLLIMFLIASCNQQVEEKSGETTLPTTTQEIEIEPTKEEFKNILRTAAVDVEEENNHFEELEETIVFSDSDDRVLLWQPFRHRTIELGEMTILSGGITRGKYLAYLDREFEKLRIVNSFGEEIASFPSSEHWVEIVDWPEEDRLLIGNMPFSGAGGWWPPASTIDFDISTGEFINIDLDYPDVFDFRTPFIDFGRYGYTLAAYDSTLTRVVYPSTSIRGEGMVLWDISASTELVKFYQKYPWGGPVWCDDGAYFIVSLPLYTIEGDGKKHTNYEDGLPYFGGNELFQVSRDGEIKRLTYLTTESYAMQRAYSWSPDGRTIAFKLALDEEESAWTLALLDLKTGEITNYTVDTGIAGSFDVFWTFDGKKVITSVGIEEANRYNLLLVDLESNKAKSFITDRVIVGLMETDETLEVVSESISKPEPKITFEKLGGKIVFSRFLNWETDPVDLQIFTMDLETGEEKQLTFEGANSGPKWSPDGTRILFESWQEGNMHDIFIMDENGGNITPAVTGPGQDICAEWSPDGKWIAYQSDISENVEIYVINLKTNEIRKLTDDPPHYHGSPYWSPDGKQLVFFSNKYVLDEFDYTSTQIFRIDIDGKNLTALTDDFGNWEFPPVWSLDDSKVIFHRMVGTYFKLMILNVNSGELEFLFDDFFPETAWEYAEGRSQVGKYLSFGVLGEEHVMDWETGKVYPIELDAYVFDYYPDVENE